MNLRRVQSLKTKRRITEVALSLFHEKGFDNVTVDEIVQKSNTSKGAFYGHFSSKYEVFFEKFKEVDNFYSEFQLQLPQDILAKEKILKLAIAQMEFLKNDLGRDLMRTIYMNALSSPNAGKLLSNTDRKLYLILEDFIQEGLDSGEIDKKHSKRELSLIITRTMRGTFYDWFIFREEMDPISEIKKILTLLLRGI